MSVADVVRDYGPLAGLLGVTITLAVNGWRAERTTRQAIHARAVEAVVAYLEMPFAIRRRRHESEHRSAERVRLTEAFSAIQAELASCEALMRADKNARVRDQYASLVTALRGCAGKQAYLAWSTPPIERDEDMGMADVYQALEPVREAQRSFEGVAAMSSRRRWGMSRS